MGNFEKELTADPRQGFTQTPNLMYDAVMCARFSPAQRNICDLIIRHTYGWHRDEVPISVRELEILFNLDRSWAAKQLSFLIEKKIVLRTRGGGNKKSVLKMNPNIFEWEENILNLGRLKFIRSFLPTEMRPVFVGSSVKKVSVSGPTGVWGPAPTGVLVSAPTGMSVSAPTKVWGPAPMPEQGPCIEQPHSQGHLNKGINKSTNKEINNPLSLNDNNGSYSLAKLLLEKILVNHPDLDMPDLGKWAYIIEEMITTDKRPPETIRKVIIFSQESDFWQMSIISPAKLRKNFRMLEAQRSREEKLNASQKEYTEEYEIFSV